MDMDRFRKFAESSDLSIMLTDSKIDPPGPKIIYANKNLINVTGYFLEELLGKTPRILQGEYTDRAVLDKVRACLVDGVPFSGVTTNYKKDGTPFLMSWTLEPITLDGVKYFYAIQTDLAGGLLKALEEVKILQNSLLNKLPELSDDAKMRD